MACGTNGLSSARQYVEVVERVSRLIVHYTVQMISMSSEPEQRYG